MVRGRKKNKFEEVEKPRGFDRNLEFEKIVGSTFSNETYFLVKWQDCTELDLLPASELYEKLPQEMIKYYESHSSIATRCNERKKTLEKVMKSLEQASEGREKDPDFTVQVKVDNSAEESGKFTMEIRKQEG
ncbi:hypothetical protein DMENIID0001_078710 [Sergentomyia squamirostris]